MANELTLNFVGDQIDKLIIFLERTQVQIQLITIVGSTYLCFLFSRWIWKKIPSKFTSANNYELGKDGSKLSPRFYGWACLDYLINPLLFLLTISLGKTLFLSQGWTAGIFLISRHIFGLYFVYKVVLLILSMLFSRASVNRYKLRFFRPIFWILVISIISNTLSDTERLSQVVLVKIFGGNITIGAVFLSTVGLYLWIVSIDILQYFIFKVLTAGEKIQAGTVEASLLLIRYFLMGLGIVLILGYIGFNTTALAAITGGLSVGIGFGLKEVFSNFISSILLIFEGALKPGDLIEVDGEFSQVKKLGFRATTVLIPKDNSEKIVPNQLFFTQNFRTYTGSDRRMRRSIIVGTSYDHNPQDVIQLLLQIADEHPEILKDPKPLAFLINFGDSSINFELDFWIDDPNTGKRVASELSCTIWRRFAENQIEIPFPQRDIHIRSEVRLDKDTSTGT